MPEIFPCSSPAGEYVAPGASRTAGIPSSVLSVFHPASMISWPGRLTLTTPATTNSEFSNSRPSTFAYWESIAT